MWGSILRYGTDFPALTGGISNLYWNTGHQTYTDVSSAPRNLPNDVLECTLKRFQKATSTFFFTGSAVYVYGRRGSDTGCMGGERFSGTRTQAENAVELDGERVQNVQLYADADANYNQLLFGAVGLDCGASHNLVSPSGPAPIPTAHVSDHSQPARGDCGGRRCSFDRLGDQPRLYPLHCTRVSPVHTMCHMER